MDDDRQSSRFYHSDGRPDHAEFAYSSLLHMFGAPVEAEQVKWAHAAHVHALLAQREGMQDLARSNRELAAAMGRVADRRERAQS